MRWQELRQKYPHKWLIVEAVDAVSKNKHRLLNQVNMIDAFAQSMAALDEYRKLHKNDPNREYYVVHTDRKFLKFPESQWLGIRLTREN